MMEWNESTTDLLFFGKKRGGGREKRVMYHRPCYANIYQTISGLEQQEDSLGLAGVLARTVSAQRHAVAPSGKEQHDVLGKDN